MEQAIEHGGDGGHVAKQFAPILNRSIGCQQRAGTLVSAHDDFNRSSAAVSGSFRIPKSSTMSSGTVVSDSMNSLRVPSTMVSAKSSSQHVGLAVEHAVALLNGSLSDRLRQVAFSRSTRTEKQCVFPLGDENSRSQIEDQTAIHLGVKTKIEIVERVLRVTEGSLFPPSRDQPLTAQI